MTQFLNVIRPEIIKSNFTNSVFHMYIDVTIFLSFVFVSLFKEFVYVCTSVTVPIVVTFNSLLTCGNKQKIDILPPVR